MSLNFTVIWIHNTRSHWNQRVKFDHWTGFWARIFESSFSVVSGLSILLIYQLACYSQRVAHFFRFPLSCRLYVLLFRDHTVCYVSSYIIPTFRYDNWWSFDSLGVINVVLLWWLSYCLTSRIRFRHVCSIFLIVLIFVMRTRESKLHRTTNLLRTVRVICRSRRLSS